VRVPAAERLIRATFKSVPEDFVVEELPAYEPSGAGEHVYVRFEKRGLNTHDAVARLARALGVHARDAGVAGQKDRQAVTTQTVSFFGTTPEAVLALAPIDGVRVLSAARHGNKLKPGHLRGNRFRIRLRDVSAIELQKVEPAFAAIARDGVPNAFGAQRFGRGKDNAERALAFLRGEERPPRDKRQRAFLFSALQSKVFNRVLERRVQDGTWCRALEGDLLKKHDSGGLFVCTDVQTDAARAERGEVSPTGPMFGLEMREPEGAVRALEHEVLHEVVGDLDLAATRGLGDGTRRVLRLWVESVVVRTREQEESCEVEFVLPKGAFATTVLGQVFELVEGSTSTSGEGDGAEDSDGG